MATAPGTSVVDCRWGKAEKTAGDLDFHRRAFLLHGEIKSERLSNLEVNIIAVLNCDLAS
jgi:hypothetical protein